MSTATVERFLLALKATAAKRNVFAEILASHRLWRVLKAVIANSEG